jgi:hypothetical protein
MVYPKILTLKFAVLIFAFFLFFPIAHSKNLIQSSESTTSELTILYPKEEFVRFNDSSYLHFHVLNSSGKSLNGTTASCFIHVYNESNRHIIEQELLEDGLDFEIPIPTDKYGHYSYNLWCNSTEREFGYLSDEYTITPSGNPQNETAGAIIIFIIALIPLFLALLFMIGAATMGEGHNILKWFLMLVSPFLIMSSLHSVLLGLIQFFSFPELINYIGDVTYYIGLLIVTFISYFIIYFIAYLFNVVKEKKDKKLEY